MSDTPSKPVPASTILVLRDQPHSLEVLLHQRSLEIPAFPGYYVYPGGKVDPEDSANYACALSHQDLQQSANHSGHKQIPSPEYWVAAIRELFEETGILAKHEFKGSKARYEELNEGHHDHLIDVKSGEIIEFVDEEIEKLQKKVAEKYGYDLVDHKLELYGVKKKS